MVSMKQENVKKKTLVASKIIFQVISRLIKYQNKQKNMLLIPCLMSICLIYVNYI